MSADPAFRQYWRLNWLGSLNEFADIGLQRRMWLDLTNRNPHWSYVEFMCKYFDDVICDRTYAQLVAEGLVSAAEATLVEPLHALLDEHEAPDGNDSNAAGVLADPAWLAITEIAKATNLRLVALLADPSERAALLSPIEV
ncbi:MAG: hypothetical protein ACHQPH_07355 [Reyranellales bacterium]